jgi:hypothetical protein
MLRRPNFDSPFAPAAQVQVTFRSWENIYVYATTTLWTAYGLAIFFTVVSIGFGLLSMARNGTGFSNDFSTIVRVGRTTTFDDRDESHALDTYPMVGRRSLSNIDTVYKSVFQRSHTEDTIANSAGSIRSARASFDNDDDWHLSDSKKRSASP